MRALILGCLLSVVLMFFGRPAGAEQPTAAEKELRDEALRLWQDDRVADARDVHLRLWRMSGRPVDAFNIGMLSYLTHDWTLAAEYLTIWLDVEPPPGPTAPQRERDKRGRATLFLEDARRHVGALVVQVNAPGADVLADGRLAGTSPLKYPIFVSPGAHRLAARLGDANSEEVLVKAEAGSEQTVRLTMRPRQAAPTVIPPRVQAPAVTPSRVQAPAAVAPAESKGTTIRRVGAGMAVGALTLGTGLLTVAVFINIDADDQARSIRQEGGPGACRGEAFRGACEQLRDTVVLRDALAGGGIASIVLGGAIAGATLAMDWSDPATPGRKAIRVRPAVGGAGLAIEGLW